LKLLGTAKIIGVVRECTKRFRKGKPDASTRRSCDFFHGTRGCGGENPDVSVNLIELVSRKIACNGISTAATKETGMTLEAMTFAKEPYYEILDHQLTDEYAAALFAMARGEPQARARLMNAYKQLREHSQIA
jgi:hypothetical protein